ncbi:MAG: Gfo/Idh/MocA family oxidoreductase, partial [Planctomycetota bacterium]
MKTWNFCIIGAGLIADFHARAIKDIPNANLISCYDVDLERAQNLAQNHSCQAMNS